MIMCSASGYPPPSLTWYKDSKKIKDNRNDEESLTIKETGGNYTCFASNSVGTSSESFDSAIFGKLSHLFLVGPIFTEVTLTQQNHGQFLAQTAQGAVAAEEIYPTA